jgi:hypothetical protein
LLASGDACSHCGRARTQVAALDVHSYEVEFDLTLWERTFGAVSRIRFATSDDRDIEIDPDHQLQDALDPLGTQLSRSRRQLSTLGFTPDAPTQYESS